jgi:hypothetical protein
MRSSTSCVSFVCAIVALLALPGAASARVAYCFPGPPATSAGVITGNATSCWGDADALRHAVDDGVSRAQSIGSSSCPSLLSHSSGNAVCTTQNLSFQPASQDWLVSLPGQFGVQRVGNTNLGLCSFATPGGGTPWSGWDGGYCGHTPFKYQRSMGNAPTRVNCGFVCR